MTIRSRLDKTFSHSLYMWLWKVRDYVFVISLGLFPAGHFIVGEPFGMYCAGIGLMFVMLMALAMIPMDLMGRGTDMWEENK